MVKFNLNDKDITDEYIYYSHNHLKEQIKIALNVIKEYIINNNLLIVGGTAIDYALKLKNDTLYNDLYQVPDFDIISPNNIEHANNIGKMLCEMEYKNISIVPAIHHTTVRVQLLGFTLFDSTFIPENIYNKIPYLQYKEYKFVDPNFQKINQYLSLSLLYKITGPSYNILNRFKKDVQRLDLLNKYYNIELSNSEYSNIEILDNNLTTFKFYTNIYNLESINIIDSTNNNNNNNNYSQINEIPKKYLNKYQINQNIIYNINSNLIFNGILAYNLIYKEFERIYSKLYNILPLTKQDKEFITENYNKIYIKLGYKTENQNLIFDIYKNTEICLINSNNIESKNSINSIINKLKEFYSISNIKHLNNILDLKPKYLECNLNNNKDQYNLKIYNLYGDLIGVNLIYNQQLDKYLPISTYTYNLMYFLTNFYLESNKQQKSLYLNYYISLYSIIKIIQYMYYKYPEEYTKSEEFINTCFNFSINTLGNKNYPDNFHYFLLNFKNLVTQNKNLDILPPKNYIGYPKCEIKNIFDKKKSEYYSDIQLEISNLGISGININYENI